MKRKWFVALAILAIAAVGVFITDQVTQAQRPDRPGPGARQGGPPGRGGMMNPASLLKLHGQGSRLPSKLTIKPF